MKQNSGQQRIKMIDEFCSKQYIGRKFWVIGLQSEKGSRFNNQRGLAVGWEQGEQHLRVHIKLEGDDTIYKIKLQNLTEFKQISQSPEAISYKEIQKYLLTASQFMKTASQNISVERVDIKYRYGKLQQHYNQYLNGNYHHQLKCGDFGTTPPEPGTLVDFLKKMKPGCVGNGFFTMKQIYKGTKSKHKAGIRWSEYSVSGFCVPCQIHYIESCTS